MHVDDLAESNNDAPLGHPFSRVWELPEDCFAVTVTTSLVLSWTTTVDAVEASPDPELPWLPTKFVLT